MHHGRNLLLVGTVLLGAFPAHGQPSPAVDPKPIAVGSTAGSESLPPPPLPNAPESSREAIYFEGATFFGLAGSLSVNYEHVFTDYLALRVGAGYAFAVFPFLFYFLATQAGGVQAMVDFRFGGPSHFFELGIGASVMIASTVGVFMLAIPVSDVSVVPSPAVSISYVYHPADGGFFFRAGAIWSYAFGLPVGLSLGYAF